MVVSPAGLCRWSRCLSCPPSSIHLILHTTLLLPVDDPFHPTHLVEQRSSRLSSLVLDVAPRHIRIRTRSPTHSPSPVTSPPHPQPTRPHARTPAHFLPLSDPGPHSAATGDTSIAVAPPGLGLGPGQTPSDQPSGRGPTQAASASAKPPSSLDRPPYLVVTLATHQSRLLSRPRARTSNHPSIPCGPS